MSVLEGAALFSWLWLFSFKYYTVAREVKLMFQKQRQRADETMRRKYLYRVTELANLILFGLVVLAMLYFGTLGASGHVFKGVLIVGVILEFLQLPLDCFCVTYALFTFRSIVKGQEAVRVNTFQIHLHNVLIVLWTACGVFYIVVLVRDGLPSDQMGYRGARDLTICDISMLILSSLISTLAGYVLYKAIRYVPKRQDQLLQKDVSLLVYIENMKSQKQLVEAPPDLGLLASNPGNVTDTSIQEDPDRFGQLISS